MRKQFTIWLIMVLTVATFTVPAIAQVSFDDAYAIVTDVDAPTTVAPGDVFEVLVTIEVNLPDDTNVEVGIYDPENWDTMVDYYDVITGYQEASYSFELEAFDVEGDFEIVADVFFEYEGEMLFTEGSESYFTVTVEQGGGGLRIPEIPGFPLLALFLGLGLTAFMLQNTKKTLI